jgi:hypothetical protein
MMSKKSRDKGHNFERSVVRLLREEFGDSVDPKRELNQWATAGLFDITGVFPFGIECKRYKDGFSFRPEWWKQVRDAAYGKCIPCLIWKLDRKPIRVTLPVVAVNPNFEDAHGYNFSDNALMPVTMDWETGAMIMREWMDCDDLA